MMGPWQLWEVAFPQQCALKRTTWPGMALPFLRRTCSAMGSVVGWHILGSLQPRNWVFRDLRLWSCCIWPQSGPEKAHSGGSRVWLSGQEEGHAGPPERGRGDTLGLGGAQKLAGSLDMRAPGGRHAGGGRRCLCGRGRVV